MSGNDDASHAQEAPPREHADPVPEGADAVIAQVVAATSSSSAELVLEIVPASPSSSSSRGSVKRPRLPDPITSTLAPRAAPALKVARTEADAAPPPSTDEPPLSPPSPPTAAPKPPPTPPYHKVPVKVLCKTPVASPGGCSLRGSPALPSPPVPVPSHSFHSTPSTTPPTTPSTPGSAALHARWIAMLERAFHIDCHPHEMERVTDVSSRIVASIPGQKAVAADTFLMLKGSLADAKNTDLRRRVLSGQLPVEVFVTLEEKDLANPERRKEMDEGFEERAKDRNITEMIKAAQTTSKLFPCPSCKVRDCTWTQKQTRSADEPMTVFCTCNKCGYKWRRF